MLHNMLRFFKLNLPDKAETDNAGGQTVRNDPVEQNNREVGLLPTSLLKLFSSFMPKKTQCYFVLNPHYFYTRFVRFTSVQYNLIKLQNLILLILREHFIIKSASREKIGSFSLQCTGARSGEDKFIAALFNHPVNLIQKSGYFLDHIDHNPIFESFGDHELELMRVCQKIEKGLLIQ